MSRPSRGEVWLVDLNPSRGHEQSGIRPALILSVDLFNNSPAGLSVLLPIASKNKGIRSHVRILPPEGGLTTESFIRCEEPRTVSQERLVKALGRILQPSLREVEQRVRLILGL